MSAKVCAHITSSGQSCPNLRPCPTHPPRSRDAGWSKGRDYAAQARFRKAVLARDGYRCTRCGSTTELAAHHVRPGYETSAGITLCGACHRHVDSKAR